MTTNTTILVTAALLPAVILCLYVFCKDRVEKEPLPLLLQLLMLGVLSCFPAMFLEDYFFKLLDFVFAAFGQRGADGTLYVSGGLFRLYTAVKYFVGVALVEEGLKWLALLFVTKKNEHFSHLFDGLIYAAFVSLGFAAFENILYVLDYGLLNAMTRAVLSVPGHMFFGVMMGYYYSLWHMTDEAARLEESAGREGTIRILSPFQSKRYAILSLAMPVLAHGFYDYCCVAGTKIATYILLLFVFFLYYYCFGKIQKISNADDSDENIAKKMLIGKYPELSARKKGLED